MNPFVLNELIYLGVWSLIGSTLGYFAFVDRTNLSRTQRWARLFLSIGIGMFIAYPIFIYCLEHPDISPKMSVMLAGLGAFGLPDFILSYHTRIQHTLADKFLCNHKHDHDEDKKKQD